jgi:predicted nucleic acid-binding Zn ribbon protein
MARGGFGRVRSTEALEAAWRQAAGPLAATHTCVAGVRRGKLEIVVASSTLLQELSFQKRALLDALARALPDEPVRALRFRVGPVR